MLASIFEKSPEVIAAAARYQGGCSFEHLLIAIYFCQLGYFNGIGKTNFVLVQGIITSFAVRIPISYILSRGNTPDLFNIGLAVPLSALFCLILCCGYMVYLNKKTKNLNKSQT
jgi:Na+-driven multidrug efflux pump